MPRLFFKGKLLTTSCANRRTGENRAWNCFDVLITGVCWAPPKVIGVEVAFIRLIRLARLLKLAEGVKELRVLVIGLVHGLSSVVYVLILMFITYYMFAVLGTVSFQRNDPFLFGSVGFAMLTLFRIATSSRTNVLLLQYYGCKTQNWMVASVSARIATSDALGLTRSVPSRIFLI